MGEINVRKQKYGSEEKGRENEKKSKTCLTEKDE
jgi:hypothetical protein